MQIETPADAAGLPGTPSLHSRVERWECDFNDHWNLKFYARSFDAAAAVMAAKAGAPAADGGFTRHMRLHSELFVSAPVEVRSGRVPGAGPGAMQGAETIAGAGVHLLFSGTRLCATALDLPDDGEAAPAWVSAAPEIPADALIPALPRGVAPGPALPAAAPAGTPFELGPPHPFELSAAGAPTGEALVRRLSVVSSHFLDRIGFTPDWSRDNGVTRMAVEMKMTRHAAPRPGAVLRMDAALLSVGAKSFVMACRLWDQDGRCLVSVEKCMLCVDLKTRRAAPVPAMIRL